jgi:hypothetical protein
MQIYVGHMKSKRWLLILVLLLKLIIVNTAIGQDLPAYHGNTDDSIPQNQQVAFYLSLSILVFGLILCLAEILVLFKKKDVCWDTSAFRVFGLTLIIVSGVFLISAGYSEYQIASMMGLLGTVAGYLLAKTD